MPSKQDVAGRQNVNVVGARTTDRLLHNRDVKCPPLALHLDHLQSSNQKDELLPVSADVLERAVDDGTWDPVIFTPPLELLENVMEGYNSSSAGVVGKDEIDEHGAETNVSRR